MRKTCVVLVLALLSMLGCSVTAPEPQISSKTLLLVVNDQSLSNLVEAGFVPTAFKDIDGQYKLVLTRKLGDVWIFLDLVGKPTADGRFILRGQDYYELLFGRMDAACTMTMARALRIGPIVSQDVVDGLSDMENTVKNQTGSFVINMANVEWECLGK